MILRAAPPLAGSDQLVLLAVDEYGLPLQAGVVRQLSPHTTPCGSTRKVLEPGPAGAPDSRRVSYYGSVHRVGDELLMWYLGQGDEPGWFQRVCLARSRDGYHWEKPDLGLVEYHGSRHNNLVDLSQGTHHVQACVVVDDPLEPRPERRFKMAFQSRKYGNAFAAACSPDGRRWREAAGNPVGTHLEMAGGTRFGDLYLLSGQGGHHGPPPRQLVTHLSYDFERWSEGFAVGLHRGEGAPATGNRGEQVHLGAALWNRGHVLVGFYGQWRGHPSSDRRLVTMDLGLAISADGLTFREPVPGAAIVAAAEDGWETLPGGTGGVQYPALIQGQGFANVGDETLFWYAPWPEQRSDGVRVARWPRDRLGYVQALAGGSDPKRGGPHVLSAPIDLQGRGARVWLNASGLSPHSQLTVQVLGERLEPLADYGAEAVVPVSQSGLRQPVAWRGRSAVAVPDGTVRLRIGFEGLRREDARLHAVYVEAAD